MRGVRAWFLPHNDDVLASLTEQLDVVEQAVQVLTRWSAGSGDADAAGQLRTLLGVEHERRRRLLVQVRDSFSTPMEPEDLFELGERLGEVAEGVYALVREAELSRTDPDPGLGRLIEAIGAAMSPLAAAVRALPNEHAAVLADDALQRLSAAEHAYRAAVADLQGEDDLRQELRRRELYRRAEHLTAAVQRVARRVWYAVYKTQ